MSSDLILTSLGRVSWSYVFGDGDTNAEGKSKYSLGLMLPKSVDSLSGLTLPDKVKKNIVKSAAKTKEVIESKALEMAKAEFGSDYKKTRWNPVLDGDESCDEFPANKGNWVIRMKSMFKPAITVDEVNILAQAQAEPDRFSSVIEEFADQKDILNRSKQVPDGDIDSQLGFYVGCWARAYVKPFVYKVKKNKGVALGISTAKKYFNDDRIGGKSATIEDGFDDSVEELDDDELFDSSEGADDLE